MKLAAAVLVLLAATCGGAVGAETIISIGEATVRYDETRWSTSVSDRSVTFFPQRALAHGLDPVVLHIIDDAAPCPALARRAFRGSAYDERSITREKTTIDGMEGVRFAAHTRCRNATPRGAVACVRVGAHAYLLEALQPGCRGRSLFSGLDPLAEITAGISFPSSR